MTDQPPITPEQTTVVGYPGTPAPPSAPYANPGIASLRGSVRTVRYLVVACLVLLVVVVVGLGAMVATSRAQLDDLTAQVSALSAQVEAAASPATESAATGKTAEVKQLGAAPVLGSDTALPSGVDETGAFLIGNPDASTVVEVYIDYQCPFCQKWEETIGKPLAEKAMQPGSDLLIKQYNLAFLGETNASLQPAGASARAASAAACVLENDGTDTFVAFSQSLFATADPSEPPGQFTAAVLTDLATKAGASDAAIACIEKETHVPFVAASTKAGFGRGVGGTPTVVVNGTTVGNPFTDEAVTGLLG